jgi:hypothetical protein
MIIAIGSFILVLVLAYAVMGLVLEGEWEDQ